MSTPASAVSSFVHTIVIWFSILWIAGFFVGRIYAFHEAYVSIRQDLANDAKLLLLCSDVEFVAMMKQHNDVCSRVQVDASVNCVLKALNLALSAPTFCGKETCVQLLWRISVWSGWTGILSLLALALCMPQIIRVLFRPRDKYISTDPCLKRVYYPQMKDLTV